jgi:ligand-binding SRPBCC domain-containing protein
MSVSIDAHVSSMVGSGEQAVAGVTSGTIGQGEFVTWEARHFGIRWRMTSQITTWDRPNLFVDEQTHGPFKSFWHEHRFVPVDNGTELRDCVRFEAPLGLLGGLAERLVLARYMPHLIDIRNEFLLAEARRH